MLFGEIKRGDRTWVVFPSGKVWRKPFTASSGREFKGKWINPSLTKKGYHTMYVGGKNEFVHRLVGEALMPDFSPDRGIDHLHGDKTNNRLDNLRVLTQGDNTRAFAKPTKNALSQYRGVHRDKRRGVWFGSVMFNRKSYYAGAFETQEEAARARDAKARELGFLEESMNFPV